MVFLPFPDPKAAGFVVHRGKIVLRIG